MTGEVRPETARNCENPRFGAARRGQQADGERTAFLNAAFRLPISQKSAYPAAKQRYERRLSGKCQFKGSIALIFGRSF
jgi:hypothetical protein